MKLDMKELIAKMLKCDYVIEQGTSGIWTYRKWSSGIAECWGIYTSSFAITTSSAGYGGYRSDLISVSAFPFTFTEKPSITAIAISAGGWWANNVADSTTTQVKFYASCGQSYSASNKSISLHCIGRWK